MLEMLQWVMDKFMEIEVSQKTGEYTENESDTEADGLTSGWEQCTCRYLKSGRENMYCFL